MHVVLLCAGSTSIAQHLFPISIVDINEYQSIQRNKKASKNNTYTLSYDSTSLGTVFNINKIVHFICVNTLRSSGTKHYRCRSGQDLPEAD